ncbi:MAG: hypothetical protein KA362_07050 [Chloroflexi bacterium]|nr:hypothetical protein [Chloroflexota bacterium]MBK8935455.1 hypothetical protein [Chloroflexota bacterium]MBP6803849.1 hypothetical protein [Chloroflexota bacterium]MBP7590452.1 hypothetical protein [Chloroflexota bacterium]
MKYAKLVVIGIVVTAVLVFGAFAVLAQENNQPTIPPVMPGYGPGTMGGLQGGMGRGAHGGMMGGFSLLDVVAQTLNLTVDEVWNELSTGISIADLAANYQVEAQAIIDTALVQHQAALDTAVAAGTLSQEQADWMQANMAAMITSRVNEPWGSMHGNGNGGGRGFGNGSGGCHGGQTAFQGTGA